jgi:uncharacterized membrane protein
MKTENKVLMAQARAILEGNWGIAVGAAAIYMFISIVAERIPLAGLIISGPMAFGLTAFYITLSRKQTPVLSDLFTGFTYFLNALVAMLLYIVYTLLWTILLVVPGIMAAISYSQVFFILVENPSMKASDAITKSKMMMDGYKWKYFCLCFRFIGWVILSVLTAGIGFLFLLPYAQVTFTKFYEDVKGSDSHAHTHHAHAKAKHEETTSTENNEAVI